MFGSDKRIGKFRDEARKVLQDGQAVYTTYFHAGTKSGTLEWGLLIEAIEAEGWRLVEWTVDQSIAYPVFRRPH